MKERIKRLKNNKAFTLIELIVVIAVLGILVLLAAPKFLGHTHDAKLAQIKADIKTNETMLAAEIVSNAEFTDGWEIVPVDKLEEYRDSGSLVSKKGAVESDYVFNQSSYIAIPDEFATESNGEYIADPNGNVFYYQKDFAASIDKNPAAVDNANPESDFKVESANFGGLSIIGYNGTRSDVVVPATIGGKPVISIYDNAFKPGQGNTGPKLTSVVLPAELNSIGYGAFQNNELTSIEFPSKVSYISSYAFAGNKIDIVEIPDTVQVIGSYAFSNNILTEVKFGANTEVIGVNRDAFSKSSGPSGVIFGPASKKALIYDTRPFTNMIWTNL